MVDGVSFDVTVSGDTVQVGTRVFRTRSESRGAIRTVYVDEQPFQVADIRGSAEAGAADEMNVLVDAQYHSVRRQHGAPATSRSRQVITFAPAAGSGGLPAPMAGRVLRVHVEPGQAVHAGDVLLIFEAMKMENELKSPRDSTVLQVAVKVGDRVSAGDLLVEIA